MKFGEIEGLAEVKGKLVTAVQNGKIPHTQLFMGKKGSPNLAMALSYTTFLNCESPEEGDSCGSCASCSKISKHVHPDVHFVFPVSSTKNITGKDVVSTSFLKNWRSFLTENPFGDLNQWVTSFGGEDKQVNISKEESRQIVKSLSLKAFEAKYKVMIIWLPEFMHPSAANGILKILEEPPEKTVFLLVSNDHEKLLSTILSRTQIVTIPKFTDQELCAILVKRYHLEVNQAEQLAHIADGDLNAAVRFMGNAENDNHQLFADWMRSCFKRDFTAMVQRAEFFHTLNKVAQKSLMLYATTMLRESLVRSVAPELTRVNGEEGRFLENFSRVMNADKVFSISEKLNEAYYHLERNASAKMLFLNLSLHISMIIK
ncbi:MAG: DNA polymerase III subunit delta [Bacteroidota bacterium]